METVGAVLGVAILGIALVVGCSFLLRDIVSQWNRVRSNSLKQELLLDTV